MLDYLQYVLVALSVLVIVVFGYRQFNQWTESETRGEHSDSELLAFAPPRSFTSHWRFLMVASLYCLTLIALYLVLYVIFRSPPEAGSNFLQVAGVTEENAWLVALFVVTGLSPILPVVSNIERSVREVMHTWAVVPTKAQQLADELASPESRLAYDKAFLQDSVLPKLGPEFGLDDFADERATSIAQKWCRLNYLLFKFAPPALGGLSARGFRSPYTNRFQQDFEALGREVREVAKSDAAALRARGGSPATVALLDKLDAMLHRLYVLMSCRAFGSARSLEAVVQYFKRGYGLDVGRVENGAFPTDPVFDALAAAAAGVLIVSAAFWYFNPDARKAVQPFAWAANTLAVHGLGVLVGWLVFSQRKRGASGVERYLDTAVPISRKYLVASVVLGFSLALVPTLIASMHYFQQVTPRDWNLLELAREALVRTWPWAFLGSATAVAVYLHLERSANKEATLRLGIWSGALQATANVGIALLIMAFYNPASTVEGASTAATATLTLSQKLALPLPRLVLLLTAVIGLALGLFLPRAVHGHGLDLRGGAVRFRPTGTPRRIVYSYMGRHWAGQMEAISMTGCVLRFDDRSVRPVPNAVGKIVLHDKTALPVQFAREVQIDRPGVPEESLCAFRFTAEQNRRFLPKPVRQRLRDVLSSGGLEPIADLAAGS